MKIGFDLDKVFVNLPPFLPAKLIGMLYKKKLNGKLLYRMPGTLEQKVRILSHYPLFRPPIKKNISFLATIPKTHKLYLISSRFGFLQKRTNSIIKKYVIDTRFDALFFNYNNQQPHVFKDSVFDRLKLDIYVDDDLPLLQYVAKRHNNIKFYWLNDKVSKQLSENIFAITRLSDIFNKK